MSSRFSAFRSLKKDCNVLIYKIQMDNEKGIDRSNISNRFGSFRVDSNKYSTTPNNSPINKIFLNIIVKWHFCEYRNT